MANAGTQSPWYALSMMSARAKQVFEDAKALSEDERGKLIDDLMETLPLAEIEAEWAEEIQRRARKAHAGESVTVSAEEHLQRLASRLSR
jgi:putative addiction module component (TIGR02574 family)